MNPDEISNQVNDTVNGASETAKAALAKAQDGLTNLKAKVQDSYSTARDTVQDGLETARGKVQDGYETARDKVQDGLGAARDKSSDVLDASVRYVRQNPIPVIAGALVLGVALGYLYMRRSEEELSLRERYDVDSKLDGARGWLKDHLTPVAEAAQRHARTAGDALDEARQRVSQLDVNQYLDPIVERTKKASSRFNFWQ